MNEPTRLRDDGPEEVRALLHAGSATRPMTREERDRTGARIDRLGRGVWGVSPHRDRYAAAAALAGGIAWLPGAAFGAGIGVAAVVVAWGVPALMSPAPATRSTAAPVPVITARAPSPSPPPAPPAPPLPPASAALPAPPAAARPPQPPARASAEAPDPLAEEAALLERARAALGASPAEALALTEAHAARFPAGKLGMEREIVAIDALRRLGRRDEARVRGEALLARTQGSLYEARVHKLLEELR